MPNVTESWADKLIVERAAVADRAARPDWAFIMLLRGVVAVRALPVVAVRAVAARTTRLLVAVRAMVFCFFDAAAETAVRVTVRGAI